MKRVFNCLAICLVIALEACGGGGGGGNDSGSGGGESPPAYSNVQPPAAPAAELVDPTKATGVLSISPDTLDPAGRHAGVLVELRSLGSSGILGSVLASTATAADGSFTIALPAGTSAADGNLMLVAHAAGADLRAYVHPGAIRIDVGSEAWVRLVETAAGKLVAFPTSASPLLKSIARSVSLYSDSTGADANGQSLAQSAERIATALRSDRAMARVLLALGGTGALPAGGAGDIGAFFAISETYAGQFVDSTGAAVVATLRSPFAGTPMASDGSWSFRQQISSMANGQLTPIVGAGADARVTADRWYTRLTGSGVALVYLSDAVGEYPQQSFPLQGGARQLDARRIAHTNLNFTGGNDEQPIGFATTETVAGVELVTVAAGQFRAVRVVNETQIVIPNAGGTISTLAVRSTMWVAPGTGVVKEVDEALLDGAAAAGSVPSTFELSAAYANGMVWPSRMTMTTDYLTGIVASHPCFARVPGTRRFVTVEAAPPVVNATSRLALNLWDMDTGQQVGATRVFAGNSTRCPVSAGTSGSVLVVESFSERNGLSIWPSDQATARSYSDIVHEVSGADLSDLASYRIEPVADAAQPTLYQPTWVASLFSAPDGSGRFIVGSVKSTAVQTSGSIPQSVQLLGPGLASAVTDVGSVLVVGVDWSAGRIFTSQNAAPFALKAVPFTGSGIDAGAAQTISTNNFVSSIWYVSATYIHLPDGSTVRLDNGTPGPHLPFTSDRCGAGQGMLVCLDSQNDRLVRYDPDALVVTGSAALGSFLRSLSGVGPDLGPSVISFYGGIPVLDASTFIIAGKDIHIGHW